MVADAADCHDVDEANQQGNQATESYDFSWARHEFLELIVTVVQIVVAIYVGVWVPAEEQSLMFLKR